MQSPSSFRRAWQRMDQIIKQAIGAAEQGTRSMSSVPWKLDEPWKQSWHTYALDEQRWHEVRAETSTTRAKPTHIQRLALYSWNIDFMLPFADSRMRTAVRHLESLIRGHPDETAAVIFLQECVESDLTLLAADSWVQKTFAITDTSTKNWQSGHYGTVTLIDRRLSVRDVFRVHYENTRMQRDGLFVDVSFPSSNRATKSIRLCNTHLESLALNPNLRPSQMQLCAKYMHSDGIDGAAVAGDFNAIQDFDRQLHSDNQLKDAYLECGGLEDDAVGGHTWGQQASRTQREQFGTSRMDKVFYCGEAWKCASFERFGAGVEVQEASERERLIGLGFDQPWITDHLGVKAVFEIV